MFNDVMDKRPSKGRYSQTGSYDKLEHMETLIELN